MALCIGLGCDLPPLKGEIVVFDDGSYTITWSDGTVIERSTDGVPTITDKSGRYSLKNKCFCEDQSPAEIK
jgi:hypothetical protein